MNRLFYLSLCFCLLTSLTTEAQDAGNVSVHLPPRLSVLLKSNRPVEHVDEAPKAKPVDAKAAPAKRKVTDDGIKPNTALSTTNEIKKIKEVAGKERVVEKTKVLPLEKVPAKTKEAPTVAAKAVKEKLATEEERERHRSVSGESGGGKFTGKGFRVQIYNGTSREEALKRKAEFMRNYPGVHTYLVFMSPHYKLKVGDYRRREDALGMYHEANDTYSPCMIVPDAIAIH